jgi:hypothetical protein
MAAFLGGSVSPSNTVGDGTGTDTKLLTDSGGRLVQNPPLVATPVGADSGNVAAAIATGTLSGDGAKTVYLTKFVISGLGATAGVNVAAALAGVACGAQNFNVGVPAGATVPMNFTQDFNPPLPGSGTGAITLTVPSFGSGNTNARVTMFGFRV